MFDERKENAAQADTRAKLLELGMQFDNEDQYRDYMRVWLGNWSSRDPGHFGRTDHSNTFGSNDCIGELDSDDEPSDSSIEGFLEKDRSSRALRRRSTALHKKHFQETVEILDAKAVREPVDEISCSSPSAKGYTRVSFPRTQPVILTTLYDELDVLGKHLSNEELYELPYSADGAYIAEASNICTLERAASGTPVFFKRAMYYDKYAEIYSRKTRSDENLTEERKKLNEECKRLADDRRALEGKRNELVKKLKKLANEPSKSQKQEDERKKLAEELNRITDELKKLVAERKRLKRLITGSIDASEHVEATTEVDVSAGDSVQDFCDGNSGKEHFVDRHVVGLKSKSGVLPARLQETKMPVTLAEPQHINLIEPHASTAGLPFRH